jgi:hypothetical protein
VTICHRVVLGRVLWVRVNEHVRTTHSQEGFITRDARLSEPSLPTNAPLAYLHELAFALSN